MDIICPAYKTCLTLVLHNLRILLKHSKVLNVLDQTDELLVFFVANTKLESGIKIQVKSLSKSLQWLYNDNSNYFDSPRIYFVCTTDSASHFTKTLPFNPQNYIVKEMVLSPIHSKAKYHSKQLRTLFFNHTIKKGQIRSETWGCPAYLNHWLLFPL